MTMMAILTGLETSVVGQAMSGESGWVWLFPIVETLHVLALTVVFGSIAMVDMRLLGFAARDSTVSRISADLLPFTWIAFALAVITGSLMFTSRASTYFYNWAFDFKFLCLFLAGLNMLVVNFGAYRTILTWDMQVPPLRARVAGGISILLWIGVIVFGRWIGFST